MIDAWIVNLPTKSEENITITAETPSINCKAAKTNYENRVKAYFDRLKHPKADLPKDIL